jgi:hypothetical protein
MNKKNFEELMAGLNDALSYAKGQASPAPARIASRSTVHSLRR